MKYAGLGFQLLATIGIFAWAGHWLDNYFNFSFPAILLTFVLIALGGNLVLLNKSLKQDK